MFKYQELIERLSIKEVNSTIKKMVDTYDLTGKFYESSWDKERTFKKYFNLILNYFVYYYTEIVLKLE